MENIGGQHDEAAEPQISVSGGLGVRITVTNAGIASLYNLSWRMMVSGPLCIGSDISGTTAVLEPGLHSPLHCNPSASAPPCSWSRLMT
jgi:hypothetical protein